MLLGTCQSDFGISSRALECVELALLRRSLGLNRLQCRDLAGQLGPLRRSLVGALGPQAFVSLRYGVRGLDFLLDEARNRRL